MNASVLRGLTVVFIGRSGEVTVALPDGKLLEFTVERGELDLEKNGKEVGRFVEGCLHALGALTHQMNPGRRARRRVGSIGISLGPPDLRP